MADLGDPKTVLRHYLQLTRDSLIWKLDGLGERDARLPRTPTGNNLLGASAADRVRPSTRQPALRLHRPSQKLFHQLKHDVFTFLAADPACLSRHHDEPAAP
jgi:hypothetical protein